MISIDKINITELNLTGITRIRHGEYDCCINLLSVIFDNDLKVIENGAFLRCEKI